MTALDTLDPQARRALRRRRQPAWITPMLATLTKDHFSDPDWIYEPKWDGERVLCFRRRGAVQLYSRNQKLVNASYPELVDALAAQEASDFVIDGEVVAFYRGRSSFERLQPRMHERDPERSRRSGVKVHYCVFDVMHLDGHDTTGVPLVQRKDLLRQALDITGPLRFTGHRKQKGEAYLAEVCAKGEEGLIAKLAAGVYETGRSKLWLKFKCVRGQELVIGGFTDPKGGRVGMGALLVGYHDEGRLRYAGKVGTGFDSKLLVDLRRKLDSLERDASPFADAPRFRSVHWVDPTLVAQVGFAEWTRDGRLRHPRFMGLRRDKAAEEVVRES